MGCYAIPTSGAPGLAPAPFGDAVHVEREGRATARRDRHARHGAKPREAQRQRSKSAPAPLLETAKTRDILHPLGAPAYTDSVAEHLYRAKVADELERMGWQSRANALRACGRAAIQIDCGVCASPHLVPFRCGARTCPTCARNAAGALVQRIAAKVQLHDEHMASVPWDGAAAWDRLTHYARPTSKSAPKGWQDRRWRVVTITRRPYDVADPFNPTLLRQQVREARRLFAAWWRLTPWGRQVRDADTRRKRSRRDTSYIVGLEIAPGGMVHFHAAIYGEFIQQRALLASWRKVLQDAGLTDDAKDGGVRVEKVRDVAGVADALKEVLKYATKGQTKGGIEQMPTPYRAASVESAFRNVRRSDIGGALRAVTSAAILELAPDDLHNNAAAACQACGVVGEWAWRGLRSRELVERNGGFGLHRIDALGGDWGDVYRPPPDRGFC